MFIAYLPIFSLAFKRLFRNQENLDLRRYISSSVARLRLKDLKISSLRRLNDLYSLTNLKENETYNKIIDTNSKLFNN